MAENEPSAESPKPEDAAQAAGEALNAAQKAVESMGADAAAAPGAADPAAAAALAAVQQALNEVNSPGAAPAASPAAESAAAFALPGFSDTPLGDKPSNIDLLADVNLNVKIELGRTRMFVEDVLRLGEGSVVELDKLAGDPVDIYVNERHVARGEVLVLNDNFCIRINEIISPAAQEIAA